VLHYFNVRGRGESIRFLLAHLGIEYEDHRIEFPDWPALKNSFEFKYLPCLQIEGKQLQVAHSILRYLAQKNELYPSDRFDIYLSESLADLVTDCFAAFNKIMFTDKNPQGWEDWLNEEGTKRLKIMQNRLIKNQGGRSYFIGNAISYLDFIVFQYLHSTYYLPDQETRQSRLSSATPALKIYADRMLSASPGIQSYLKTRPTTMA
jgi:glutathione S-transferase